MSLKGFLNRTRDLVEKNGFTVMNVFQDVDFPAFSYTVGFTNKGLPELVLVGLDPEVAHEILLQAGQMQLEGKTFELGDRVGELIKRFDCLIGSVEPAWTDRLCRMAEVFAGEAPVRALQIIWPDAEGLFPGEPGYDARFFELQPLLSVEPDEDPEGEDHTEPRRLH